MATAKSVRPLWRAIWNRPLGFVASWLRGFVASKYILNRKNFW